MGGLFFTRFQGTGLSTIIYSQCTVQKISRITSYSQSQGLCKNCVKIHKIAAATSSPLKKYEIASSFNHLQNKRKLKGQKGPKQEASTYYQRYKLPWNLHTRTPKRHNRTMLTMQLKTTSRTNEKRIFKTFGDV
jgi:hypothetical protein